MLVTASRRWVMIWGVALTGFTLLMFFVKERLQVNVLPLAFGMTTYTMGPLLGMFLCALLGKGSFRGIMIGATLSFVLTMFVRTDVWAIVSVWTGGVDWLAALPSYESKGSSGGVTPTMASFWMWPIGTFLTLGCGLMGAKFEKK